MDRSIFTLNYPRNKPVANLDRFVGICMTFK